MDSKRIPIKVNLQQQQPTEFNNSRLLSEPQLDIRDRMNQRMREFEEESRKWREQFISSSGLNSNTSLLDRPRMFTNFPDFPEIGSHSSNNWPLSSTIQPLGRSGSAGFFPPIATSVQGVNTHKSFIEEDNEGNKKHKLLIEIGDFKPNEISVRTEGRVLIIKGDRELVAGSATESKQFNREITLPDFVEPTTVTSYLSDGLLSIEAPVIMERLAISGGNLGTSTTHSSSMTSSSMGGGIPITTRRSPFRDNSSPSRTMIHTSNNLSSSQQQQQQQHNAGLTSSSIGNSLFTDNINTGSSLANNSATQIGAITNSIANYKFNMSEFKPEDISITVTDTTLKIHAVREENEPRGIGKSYREFKREIGLPQGADVKRLKNSLQTDGFLYIEIPVNDNNSLKPPLSPTGFNKQFTNLSLSAAPISSSTAMDRNSLLSSTTSNTDANERVNINDKELKITFDLNGYKPEDVNIKVTDNTLKVHAVHIDNSRGNQIHREYSRSYILPEWVNPELLRARMSDNGTLTVEVPLPQVQPNKFERVINIQQ
jgi:HSP20 family molecular chaperone IbpA